MVLRNEDMNTRRIKRRYHHRDRLHVTCFGLLLALSLIDPLVCAFSSTTNLPAFSAPRLRTCPLSKQKTWIREPKIHNFARRGGLPLLESSANKNVEESSSAATSSSWSFASEQELSELQQDLDYAVTLMEQNQQSIGISREQLAQRVADLEREQSEPDFWDERNSERATTVNQLISESSSLQARLDQWDIWYGDAMAALEMLQDFDDSNPLPEDEEQIKMLLKELRQAVSSLHSDTSQAELDLLLSGPYDDSPARLIITAGAGGTEANDWVAMLTRMYQRYCDRNDSWTCTTVDMVPGDVTGYKSVELLVRGPRAYGWLRSERGAHRLVRISPFNAQNKRQTTFAGVDVAPDLPDTTPALRDLEIAERDLVVTTSRSGGKGGQNVNKVNSAVRIKHLPTGLAVRCTDERSQLQNKEIALARLKAQLLAIAQEQRCREIQEIRGDAVQASWGAQIRNYVLHPYKQVKDQRTAWETSNAEQFLDGELLDDCMGAYLRFKAKANRLETETEKENR